MPEPKDSLLAEDIGDELKWSGRACDTRLVCWNLHLAFYELNGCEEDGSDGTRGSTAEEECAYRKGIDVFVVQGLEDVLGYTILKLGEPSEYR